MADLPLHYGIQVFNGDFVGRAYKPAKKIVEKTVESVPLPVPRPMDKLLEFTPFVPSQGLDLPTVGTAWLLSPLTYLGTKMNELTTAVNIYEISDYWIYLGLGISAVALLSFFASLVVGSIYLVNYLIRKFW